MRIALALFVLLLPGLVLPGLARAHDFSPGVLTLVETEPGVYRYTFAPPVDDGVALESRLRFPAECEATDVTLRCPGGLRGEVTFGRGIDRRTQIVVTLTRLDGRRRETVVSGAAPTWEVGETGGSFGSWVWIGAEHVWLGFDHLAFVLGLLLVLAGRPRLFRRALAAITAFTVAHSITLAAASLGLLEVPTPPVEAAIALSVVLLARESLHDRDTWTRRAPWIVALIFGLVHGLGFASALADIGLPAEGLAPALLGFNLGVELAQISVVAAALGLLHVFERRAALARRALAYGIGAVGALWLVERCAGLGA